MAEDLSLVQASLELGTNSEPELRSLGAIDDFDEDTTNCRVEVQSGEIYLGHRSDANELWHGSHGDLVQKTTLPFELKSWVPVGPGQIVGIDIRGRISLLIYEAGTWEQRTYIGDFIAPTGQLVCATLDRPPCAGVLNGEEFRAVEIDASGFGNKLEVGLNVAYGDDHEVEMSPCGLLATVDPAGVIKASIGSGEQYELGVVYGRMPQEEEAEEEEEEEEADEDTAVRAWALSRRSGLIAFADAQNHLRAARFSKGALSKQKIVDCGELQAAPIGMEWSSDDSVLAVTFRGGSWAFYSAVGWNFDAR